MTKNAIILALAAADTKAEIVTELADAKVPQLRLALKSLGLPAKGKKADLIAALIAAENERRSAAQPAETTALPTDRKIYNAVQKLSGKERDELAERLDVPTTRETKTGKTTSRYMRDIVRGIAKAIVVRGELPAEVAAHIATGRSRKAAGERAPKRIDSIVRILRAKGGATLDEAAEQLVVDFPTATGGAKATAEAYQVLVRRAIGRLRAGTLYAVAKALRKGGETVVRDDEGRYRIAAA